MAIGFHTNLYYENLHALMLSPLVLLRLEQSETFLVIHEAAQYHLEKIFKLWQLDTIQIPYYGICMESNCHIMEFV